MMADGTGNTDVPGGDAPKECCFGGRVEYGYVGGMESPLYEICTTSVLTLEGVVWGLRPGREMPGPHGPTGRDGCLS
jgi:hypothetical protein